MYKVYVKYFGDLIESIDGVDGTGDSAENFELGEQHVVDTIKQVGTILNDLLQKAKQNGFVVDIETQHSTPDFLKIIDENTEFVIRLFFEKQENWNNYYEIIVQKKTKCLNCGKEDFRELYGDNMGKYCICNYCDSTFDV